MRGWSSDGCSSDRPWKRWRWNSPDGLSGSALARTNQTGDVAHLAAGARLALAVKVEMGGRVGEDVAPARHILSDQILHRDFGDNQIGGAERQAADQIGRAACRERVG